MVISNFTTLTLDGFTQAFLTLYNYLTFLADIISYAPFKLSSYDNYYPMPDDAPVTQITFPEKSGLESLRAIILYIEYSINNQMIV